MDFVITLAVIIAAILLTRYLWRVVTGEDERRAQDTQLRQWEIAAEVEIARAQAAQQLPIQHYAPHITYSPHTTGSAQAAAAPAARDDAPAVAVPTFAELLEANQIVTGGKLVIGHTPDGTCLSTRWDALYSSAIGGLSGSGKSWTAVNLVTQSLLQGASVAVIDPDAHDPNSLSGRLSPLHARFLTDPAQDDDNINHLVSLLLAELEGRIKGERDKTPLVVAIDEYNDLVRGLPTLAGLVDTIGRRGRRVGMFCLAMSHQWQGKRTGGSDVRDVFASAFIHRLRPAQARMLTGMTADDLPDDVLQLPEGHAYLLDTRGRVQRVIVPHIAPGDVQRVAALLTDNAPTMERAVRQPVAIDQPHNSHLVRDGYCASASAISHTPEDARIVSLFLDGMDAAQIVKEIHGINSKAGKPYMAKLADVQAVIRSALQQREVGQ